MQESIKFSPVLDSVSRLIRIPEVRHLTGLARSTIYHQIKHGAFPVPVNLTAHRSSAWVEAEVLGWIGERISSRNAEVAA